MCHCDEEKNHSALCLINVKKKMPHLDSCGQKFVLNFKRSFWKFCFNIILKLKDRIFLSLQYLASELETLNTRKEDVVSYSINHTRLKLGCWENTQHPKQWTRGFLPTRELVISRLLFFWQKINYTILFAGLIWNKMCGFESCDFLSLKYHQTAMNKCPIQDQLKIAELRKE